MESLKRVIFSLLFLPLIPVCRVEDTAASSSPEISIVRVDPMGVILECEAGGLIYRPEMTWLDSDGNILPDGPTETDSEGHYTEMTCVHPED
ncbi:selection and upkeep of intraepithelial T-cells protein 10-like [Esox lucius]|uniref:selection and upkeep of intraepithelial T-cells protein 10-like n=1 Tax=Esox lucius TaxID=8010 RepID=UPI0014774D20|nr:selection and upkeep of intraepithelial T-cells protein 10-like [Esox lucius]